MFALWTSRGSALFSRRAGFVFAYDLGDIGVTVNYFRPQGYGELGIHFTTFSDNDFLYLFQPWLRVRCEENSQRPFFARFRLATIEIPFCVIDAVTDMARGTFPTRKVNQVLGRTLQRSLPNFPR